MQPRKPVDAALLAELSTLLRRLDPLPDKVIADAERAGTQLGSDRRPRRLELVLDTAAEIPAGVRGRSSARRLDFDRDGTLLSIEIIPDGPVVRLVGLIDPVHWPAGHAESTVDDVGCFRFGVLPAGPLRTEIRACGQATTDTSWFVT